MSLDQAILDRDDAELHARVAGIVRDRGGVLTPRELSRRLWRFRHVNTARALLQAMVDRNLGFWIDCPAGARGGRPSRMFALADDASTEPQAPSVTPAAPSVKPRELDIW